jgi:hypothetical protein
MGKRASPVRADAGGVVMLTDLPKAWAVQARADAVNCEKMDESILAAMAAQKARCVCAALYYSFA